MIRGYYEQQARNARQDLDTRESPSEPTWKKLAAIPIMLFIASYVFYPQRYNWARLPLPPSLQWLGLILGVISLVLLLWIHRTLGNNFSNSAIVQQGNVLITNGPYHWVRHPI